MHTLGRHVDQSDASEASCLGTIVPLILGAGDLQGTIYPQAARIGGIRVCHEADVELLRRREQVPSTAAGGK